MSLRNAKIAEIKPETSGHHKSQEFEAVVMSRLMLYRE